MQPDRRRRDVGIADKPRKRRPAADAADRAVREVQAGHGGQYLRQHQADALAALQGNEAARRRFAGGTGGIGWHGGGGGDDPVLLEGVFVIDYSPIDGPTDRIV
jgi:hypothetical protein